MAVKSDVRVGRDIAYVTRGHASGCAGAMAYYTRTGDPPGTTAPTSNRMATSVEPQRMWDALSVT